MSLTTLYSIIAIIFALTQAGYWYSTAKTAKKAKPFTKQSSLHRLLQHYILRAIEAIVALQLLGILEILPYPPNPILQTLGLIIVITGVTIDISARKTLSTNWTHAFDYQIKTNHTLITTGVYRFIRHPIYASLTLACLGAELIINSYLSLILIPILLLGAYLQAKKEETLLTQHFGTQYKTYMKKTKMLIPYIF